MNSSELHQSILCDQLQEIEYLFELTKGRDHVLLLHAEGQQEAMQRDLGSLKQGDLYCMVHFIDTKRQSDLL